MEKASPGTLLEQASDTAEQYARRSLIALAKLLEIDDDDPAFAAKVAPFANVWAAMISAAAKDFDTSMRMVYPRGLPS